MRIYFFKIIQTLACVQSQWNAGVPLLAQRHRATEELAKIVSYSNKTIYLPVTLLDTFLFKVQTQIKVDTWHGKVE